MFDSQTQQQYFSPQILEKEKRAGIAVEDRLMIAGKLVNQKKSVLLETQFKHIQDQKHSRTDPYSEQIMAEKRQVAVHRLFEKLNQKQQE